MIEAYGACGACAAASEAAEAVKAGNFKSWMCLLPSSFDDASCPCPKAEIEAAGAVFAHVPVDVPTGLTRSKAQELYDVMSKLPTPIIVQCATGNRASAVVGTGSIS